MQDTAIWQEGSYSLYYREILGNHRHKTTVQYVFYFDGNIIFQGTDYHPSPLCSVGDNKCTSDLLMFLSLKPGDTDKEYFENYTQEQLDFANKHGEYLSLLASELIDIEEQL